MTLPNFLIVGAQRAGTTTLYAVLRQHPMVFMPEHKEPGFFIRGFDDPERFQNMRRPDDGRHARRLDAKSGGCFTLEDYKALFAPGSHLPLRGEASTPYLASPSAPRRIAELIPQARIIVLLRDPVERAYSAYVYNVSRGTEPALSFEEAIESEMAGERDDWTYGWRYLYTGLYAQHLLRFLNWFPREQILLLEFGRVRQDISLAYADVCRFLGVEPIPLKGQVRENVSVVHGSDLLKNLRIALTSENLPKRLVKRFIPRPARRTLAKKLTTLIDRFGVRPLPMDDRTRARLAEHFSGPNEELRLLFDVDISSWTWSR